VYKNDLAPVLKGRIFAARRKRKGLKKVDSGIKIGR